jgi:hypothetical protein
LVDVNLGLGLVTVFVGLGLAFIGRKVIKILVFAGAGLVGASLIYGILESRLDQPIPLVAALIAFVILGFLSLAVLKFIFGVMLGIGGYLIINALTSNQLMAILAGIVIFVLGLFLFKYYLSLASAVGGATLVFVGLQMLDLGQIIPFLVAVVVGILGLYVQVKQLHD